MLQPPIVFNIECHPQHSRTSCITTLPSLPFNGLTQRLQASSSNPARKKLSLELMNPSCRQFHPYHLSSAIPCCTLGNRPSYQSCRFAYTADRPTSPFTRLRVLLANDAYLSESCDTSSVHTHDCLPPSLATPHIIYNADKPFRKSES